MSVCGRTAVFLKQAKSFPTHNLIREPQTLSVKKSLQLDKGDRTKVLDDGIRTCETQGIGATVMGNSQAAHARGTSRFHPRNCVLYGQQIFGMLLHTNSCQSVDCGIGLARRDIVARNHGFKVTG